MRYTGIDMPVIGSEYSVAGIVDILSRATCVDNIHKDTPNYMHTSAAIEQPQAFPKMSRVSIQRMGQANGIFQGIFGTLGIPFHEVHPRTWQKTMHRGIRAKTTKLKSFAMADRMGIDKELSEGATEALLIAEWYRRNES